MLPLRESSSARIGPIPSARWKAHSRRQLALQAERFKRLDAQRERRGDAAPPPPYARRSCGRVPARARRPATGHQASIVAIVSSPPGTALAARRIAAFRSRSRSSSRNRSRIDGRVAAAAASCSSAASKRRSQVDRDRATAHSSLVGAVGLAFPARNSRLACGRSLINTAEPRSRERGVRGGVTSLHGVLFAGPDMLLRSARPLRRNRRRHLDTPLATAAWHRGQPDRRALHQQRRQRLRPPSSGDRRAGPRSPRALSKRGASAHRSSRSRSIPTRTSTSSGPPPPSGAPTTASRRGCGGGGSATGRPADRLASSKPRSSHSTGATRPHLIPLSVDLRSRGSA